jgi:beta-glucosidase
MFFSPKIIPVLLGSGLALGALSLVSCGGGGGDGGSDVVVQPVVQPVISARGKSIITVDGLKFKDLNGNKKLDPYEDWRLSPAVRADNLINSSDPNVRMTLAEKLGMMLNSEFPAIGGNYPSTEIGGNPTCAANENPRLKYVCEATGSVLGTTRMINELNVRYMILRSNPPVATLTTWLNNIQQIAEESRLGIPVVTPSNPRNHVASGIGLSEASGVFSFWPGSLGLAATHDPALVKEFADIARQEWRATGIRKGYMYQVELATEPRWTRDNGTFGDDPDLNSAIATALVKGFQGDKLGPDSVALTNKHFPGNGVAPRGYDSHNDGGKAAIYKTPGSLLNYHMKPFQASVDAGVSSIMSYYQLPSNQSATQLPIDYWVSPTQQFEEVGMAFNVKILSYLFNVMGFKGYVNSDTGVYNDGGQSFGVETLTPAQRIAKSINSGVSLLGGVNSNLGKANEVRGLTNALTAISLGYTTEAKVNSGVVKLLQEIFTLGLFENPFNDVDAAVKLVNNADFKAKAALAHRKSIVLLKNDSATLPLASTSTAAVKIYGEVFTKSNAATATTNLRTLLQKTYPNATMVTDYTQATHSVLVVSPSSYQGTDAQGIYIKIALDTDTGIDVNRIKAIEAATKTVIAINMGNPWLVDAIEPGAKAILATYDVTSDALTDVLTGAFKPTGTLPMAIPKNQAAIDNNASDVPGHLEAFDYPYTDSKGNKYTFHFGLTYP